MKFQSKVSSLISGIFLIFCAIGLEIVGIIVTLPEGKSGIIALICMTIFFCGWLIFAGIWAIRGYIKSANCIKNALNKYGKENIIKDVDTSTRIKYKCSITAKYTYFTDNFVVQPDIAIFNYDEIGMIYKNVNVSGSIRGTSIAFALIDGNTYYLCDYVNDKTILNIFKHCTEQNPNILIGNSKENKKQYKEYVKIQ